MPDANQSEWLTQQLETSAARTREQHPALRLDAIPQTEQANIGPGTTFKFTLPSGIRAA
jgi:hypothetical protein